MKSFDDKNNFIFLCREGKHVVRNYFVLHIYLLLTWELAYEDYMIFY